MSEERIKSDENLKKQSDALSPEELENIAGGLGEEGVKHSVEDDRK